MPEPFEPFIETIEQQSEKSGWIPDLNSSILQALGYSISNLSLEGNVIKAVPISIAAIFILAGCASVQGYKDTLQTWVGVSDSRLIEAWGEPTNSYSTPDGKTILEYHRQRDVILPGYTYNQTITGYQNGTITGDVNATYMGHSTTYIPTTTPSQTLNKSCDTRFIVSNHTIASYSFNGNDCVAVVQKEVSEQKNAAQEATTEWKRKFSAFCTDPQFVVIRKVDPCDEKDITLDLLANNQKITDEQKTLFVKFDKIGNELNAELKDIYRRYGGPNGIRASDIADSMAQEKENAALELYQGKITWGEYLQRRKDFTSKLHAALGQASK